MLCTKTVKVISAPDIRILIKRAKGKEIHVKITIPKPQPAEANPRI